MSVPTKGFRFSKTDGLVLLIALVVCILLSLVSIFASVLIIFIVLHFFLFCNVFRIRRNFELIWSIIFIFQMVVNSFLIVVPWYSPLLIQFVFTFLFVFMEMKSPRYHGVFADRINPDS